MVKTLKEKMLERRVDRLEKLVASNKRLTKYEGSAVYVEEPYYAEQHIVLQVSNLKWGDCELFKAGNDISAHAMLELSDVVVTVSAAFRGGREFRCPNTVRFKDLSLYIVSTERLDRQSLHSLMNDDILVEFPQKNMTFDCYHDGGVIKLSLGWDRKTPSPKKNIPVVITDSSGNSYDFEVETRLVDEHSYWDASNLEDIK